MSYLLFKKTWKNVGNTQVPNVLNAIPYLQWESKLLMGYKKQQMQKNLILGKDFFLQLWVQHKEAISISADIVSRCVMT